MTIIKTTESSKVIHAVITEIGGRSTVNLRPGSLHYISKLVSQNQKLKPMAIKVCKNV